MEYDSERYQHMGYSSRRSVLDFQRAFESVDLIAGPTAPTPAFQVGEKTGDPLSMYLSDIYTITANLTALPALSVPCGFTERQLPVGLQLIGPAWSEARLLAAARAVEQTQDLAGAKPPLLTARTSR